MLNAFIEIVNGSNLKPNILWVDQGREFYNKHMQESLDNNDILMYPTQRFTKTLTAKIYKKNEN